MKEKIKIIFPIFVLAIAISFPLFAHATSGACSWHGGVNCTAGADWDGSVICNDGWRDSTVSYYSTNECSTLQSGCTVSELEALQQKYGVPDLWAEMTDIINQVNILEQQMIGGNTNLSYKILGLLAHHKDLSSQLSTANSLIDSECKALGADRELKLRADALKAQLEAKEQERQRELDSLKAQQSLLEEYKKQLQQSQIPSCLQNSSYNESINKCQCNYGYVTSNNQCITGQEWCFSNYGNYVNFNSDKQICECTTGYVSSGNSCITYNQLCQNGYGINAIGYKENDGKIYCKCLLGYEWNSSQTACIKKVEITITPTPTPTPSVAPTLSQKITQKEEIKPSSVKDIYTKQNEASLINTVEQIKKENTQNSSGGEVIKKTSQEKNSFTKSFSTFKAKITSSIKGLFSRLFK